jgi:hypothetical protein
MSKQKHFFPQSTAIDGVSQTSGGITLREYVAIELYIAMIAGRQSDIYNLMNAHRRKEAIQEADDFLKDLKETCPVSENECPACVGNAALHSEECDIG